MVDHFCAYYSKELKKPLRSITPEGIALLTNHRWSGNVRELQNVIERSIILSDRETITADELGLRSRASAGSEGLAAELPQEGTLQEVGGAAARMAEERLIRKILKETGGNKSRAAEILQVSYKTLLTKIKDYAI